MRIHKSTFLAAIAMSSLLFLEGCGPVPNETADSTSGSTSENSSQSRIPMAASGGGGGGGGETQQQDAGQSASDSRAPMMASSGGGNQQQQQQQSSGNSSSASMTLDGGGDSRAPMLASSGGNSQQQQSSSGNSSASMSLSSDGGSENRAPSMAGSNGSTGQGSANASLSGGRGRTAPPAGSNYGNTSQPPAGANSPYGSSGRGRTAPPAGSGYGSNTRPEGVYDPYQEGRGGQQGGSRAPTQANSGGGGGQSTSSGGAGGASMTLDGGGDSGGAPAAASGGGAGGASMSLDGGGGFTPNRPNQPVAPKMVEEKSFYDMGINAFTRGEDLAGVKFMQAEIATNPSRIDELPPQLWSQGKKLSLGVRLGIGLHYITAGDFSGKPPVIGDPRPSTNRTGFGSSGGPSMGTGGSGRPGGDAPKGAQPYLEYYAGDMAKSVLSALDERMHGSDAPYGALGSLNVKPVIEIEASRNTSSSANSSQRRGPTSMGSDGSSYGGSSSQNGPAEGFYPGLVFLGEGSHTELLKKAEKENLDGIIVIQQKVVVPPRTGQATSDTTVVFYTVIDGKKRGSTKSLNYAMVASDRTSGETPVEDEVEKLFSRKIDSIFTLGEMPTLTQEQAAGRLESLKEKSKDDPLPFLMEASFYVHKGWLDIDTAQQKVIDVVGEENALKIFSESFETQREGLKNWLPKPAKG